MLARMPVMAITTRSSIKVNPPVVRGIPEIWAGLGGSGFHGERVIGVFTLVKRISAHEVALTSVLVSSLAQ